MSVVYIPFSTSIAYTEEKRRETITFGANSSSRTLICAWSDRVQLARDLVGTMTVVASMQYIYRLPAPHPDIPGIVAMKVDIEGFGVPDDQTYNDTKVIEHSKARLTVTYGLPPFTEGGGDDDPSAQIGDERIGSEINFLQLPGEKVYWDAAQEDPLDNVDAPTILQVVDNWDVTLKDMPEVPPDLWSLKGKVNDAPVTSTRWNKTFEAETLLIADANLSTKIVAEGRRTYDVQIRFSYRPTGWNKFFRRGGDPSDPATAYKAIYNGAGAVLKPYPVADLSSVLALVGS